MESYQDNDDSENNNYFHQQNNQQTKKQQQQDLKQNILKEIEKIQSERSLEQKDRNHRTQHSGNIIEEYVKEKKIESILFLATKRITEKQELPKNPYCDMTRTIVLENMKNNLINNFEEISRKFRKNQVDYQDKFQIASLGQQFKVYGLKHILEFLDIQFLSNLVQSIDEILPDLFHQFQDQNIEIQVANGISGGLIFKSDLIPFATSHPKELEIFTEIFVKAPDEKSAITTFANFVYDDVMSVSNIEDMHILKEFVFYQYDESSQKKVIKKGWKKEDILRKQGDFISSLEQYVENSESLYWKGYMKVERFNKQQDHQEFDFHGLSRQQSNYSKKRSTRNLNRGIDMMFDMNKDKEYQYIENESEKKSFQNVPLGGLMKGIYLKREIAEKYASFFYSPDQTIHQSEFFEPFAQNQLKLVLKKWQDQNILACSWELFYMAMIIQQDDMRRNLLDSILQILTSSLSALVSLSKTNLILQDILKLYERTGNDEILRPIIMYTFKELRDGLELQMSKSSNADLLRYKEYIRILIKYAVDKENQLIIGENTLNVLGTLRKITKYIGLGNLQQIGSLTRNVPDYIYNTLKQNNLIEDENIYLTYDNFIEKKHVKYFINVIKYLQKLKAMEEYQGLTPEELENALLISYLNDYQIKENIYTTLKEIFFDKLYPDPFQKITAIFESKALFYSIKDISNQEVQQKCLTKASPNEVVGNAGRGNFQNEQLGNLQTDGTLQADIYQIQTPDMLAERTSPVYGVLEVVSIAGNKKLANNKQVMDEYHWKKAIKSKIPTNYHITDMLTVSVFDMFVHPLLLQNDYIQYYFSWDFVIKGRKEENARQIYLDILVKYAQWIEEDASGSAALGFFIGENLILGIDEIIRQSDSSSVRNKLGSFLEKGEKIEFKMLLKQESFIKIANLTLNYVFIDEYNEARSPRDIRNSIDTYIRLFFRKEEALSWYKIFPYSRMSVNSLAKSCIKKELAQGELGRAMKLELVNLFIHENTESFIDNVKILCGYSEKFYNHAKETQAYKLIIQYIKDKTRMQLIVSLQDIKNQFLRFSNQFVEPDLYDYENIYMDNLGASVINQLELAKAALQQEPDGIKQYIGPMNKVIDMLDFIADSAVLSFQKMTELEYKRKFLFSAALKQQQRQHYQQEQHRQYY